MGGTFLFRRQCYPFRNGANHFEVENWPRPLCPRWGGWDNLEGGVTLAGDSAGAHPFDFLGLTLMSSGIEAKHSVTDFGS